MEQDTVLWVAAPAFCQHFHPSRSLYAVGCIDGVVRVYKYSEDYRSVSIVWDKNVGSGCRVVAFKLNYLLCGMRNGVTVVLNCADGTELFRTSGEFEGVASLLWVTEKLFLVGYDDGTIRGFDHCHAHQPQRFLIEEFEDPVSRMVLHPDHETFYAVGGSQLGLFNIARKNYGTRLLAMSDPNIEEMEDMILLHDNHRILCSCVDRGIVVYAEGDLGTFHERFDDLRYAVHSLLKLDEKFFLAGGETGQVLVGQIYPHHLIGVFAELKRPPLPLGVSSEGEDVSEQEADDHDDESDDDEAEDDARGVDYMAIDSMVSDHAGQVVAFIDNSQPWVIIRSLKGARDICEGTSVGVRTEYAEFIDEL